MRGTKTNLSFRCVQSCSDICCTGATMLTIEEVARHYLHFPILLGFRKYTPVDRNHRDFLETIGERIGSQYIIGDFIGGNWRAPRCAMLNASGHCKLHVAGCKPLQCQIVPFCAIYEEDQQDLVLAEQRRKTLRFCKGFQITKPRPSDEIWNNGHITNETTRWAFYRYRDNLLRQRGFTLSILTRLKESPAFSSFLDGNGILESPIPADALGTFLKAAGLAVELIPHYVQTQSALCKQQLEGTYRDLIYQDMLSELQLFAAS